jgi:hypothetical protein
MPAGRLRRRRGLKAALNRSLPIRRLVRAGIERDNREGHCRACRSRRIASRARPLSWRLRRSSSAAGVGASSLWYRLAGAAEKKIVTENTPAGIAQLQGLMPPKQAQAHLLQLEAL